MAIQKGVRFDNNSYLSQGFIGFGIDTFGVQFIVEANGEAPEN